MLPVGLDNVSPRGNQESLDEEYRVEAHLNWDSANIKALALRKKCTEKQLKDHAKEVKATKTIETIWAYLRRFNL